VWPDHPPVAFKENQMVQPCSVARREQVVDIMIALTRLSNLHRTIVGGRDSMNLYVSLRRRGFTRIATPVTCALPRRQYTVALVTGGSSLLAIESALAQASPFLSDNAALAILIGSREGEFCMKIRKKLEQIGFRIEAGVRCHDGLLSAHRQSFGQGFCQGSRQILSQTDQAA
jgi:hypothetical protein